MLFKVWIKYYNHQKYEAETYKFTHINGKLCGQHDED